MSERSTAPYRAGVVGCGAIGSSIEDDIAGASFRMGLPYGHAPAYRAVTRTTLVSGADPDPARRQAFSDRWQLPPAQVYADYREMLAHERLDVVSVACPTPLHAEITLAAVEAGVRAIFLDKPVASSLEECDRVVAACRAAGIPVMVNHTRRGDPVYRKARQLIDDGTIGELHSIVAHFNGKLMWTGSHGFDLLNYFNGDRPAAWMTGHLDEAPGYDPGGSAYIVYENGVRAFVNGSTGNSILFRVQVIGSAGEIIIGNYDLELWRTDQQNQRPELLRYPFPQVLRAISPMVLLVEELIDALEGGAPPMSSAETGTSAVELIAGLHASSRQGGQPVTLPLADRSLDIPSL